MDKTTTSARLRQLLLETGWKQADVVRMCAPLATKFNVKMGKSAISQYVSGKSLPAQRQLSVLGIIFNVSEAWLMGYDVPKERIKREDWNHTISDSDLRLLEAYHANPSAQVFINRMLGLPDPEPEGRDAT